MNDICSYNGSGIDKNKMFNHLMDYLKDIKSNSFKETIDWDATIHYC